ncbi:hypothetical protein HY745_03395, partial [Candidatus Desantisbacteria bacterium]|nr:hypothetical protein [Candidatus Desantisbacteria bacterium]
GIIINNNGNYCIKLQHNNNYIKGNEESIQVDSIQKTIKWNKSTKIIKFEVSSGHHLKDKINNNLLPYWLKWKNSRLNWEEWKKNNLAGKNINRKKQGDKALGDSPSGMNLRKVELINQVSARDISMCYSISPDNNWLIFFPDGLWQGNNFILFNLIKYKQIPVKWEENIKDCSTINWNIFWKSNQEAFFCENNNPPSSCYKLILNDSEASVIKTLNYNDKNAKFISIIDNKCEIFSSSDSFEFQKLPRKHPELQFKETEQDLKIYYNKNLITAHKSDPPFRPYFHSVAFSPNKKFAFYCVDWEGSSFGNTQASLYLLDILKKKVTLIDEDFITDDPLFMIWTGDSKKFIYRRPGNKELFWKLILISFE